jgi:membrane protease YdiL (CAAX protease family)
MVRDRKLFRTTPADVGVAAATAVGLVAWNNLVAARPWHASHYVFANLMGTAALLTLARLRGVSAGELGLSSQRVAAGARAGAAVGAPIMAIWAAVVVLPDRARLRDARLVGLSARTVGYHAAVRVPLGTAVWEEVAFRAVLPALLRRVMSARTAGAVNAVVFGLWHIRPTLDAIRVNGIATTRPRRSVAGAGAVAAGALVDVLLSFLHRWCGSLLAPTLVHVASNSGGTVAAAVAGRARPLPKTPSASCAASGAARRPRHLAAK